MTSSEIRKLAQAAFGQKNARVTRQGEVHAYGVMPNTSRVGWYLYGYVGDAVTEARLRGAVPDTPRSVGRPATFESVRRVNIYLPDESIKLAQALGNGNLSAGIRKALDAAT